jgi:inorganic pyrophosphatase
MVLLRVRPIEAGGEIYEFRMEDILFAEELPSLSKPNGVAIEQTRIWVRRGSPAMRMQPMRVGEISSDS